GIGGFVGRNSGGNLIENSYIENAILTTNGQTTNIGGGGGGIGGVYVK
ncbi:unnamed protein product, partial [marine sediment metagenome]